MADEQFNLDTVEGIFMDCYTSPETQGFRGVIKRHSEEFVVTELDGHGQLVSLTSRHIPPAPPPPPAVVKPSKPRPLPSTVPPLSDLVTSDHVRCLQELAEECKSLSQPEGRVELGCYDDKERRSLVHVAVRLTYPMLMTQTDRRDEGGVCVTALPDPNYPMLREVLSVKDTEELMCFINTASRDHTLLLSPLYDRQVRTKIHLLLHKLYGGLLTTHTHTGQGKRRKLNKTTPATNQQATPTAEHKATPTADHPSQISVAFRRSKAHDPTSSLVTKFVLRKRNIESLTAINLLSDLLNCQPSHFSIAGVKDKKAVTTQLMSVRGVDASRLDLVNASPKAKGLLEVGNYQYAGAEVSLGEHSGNHFKIVIRDVLAREGGAESLDRVVAMAMTSVKEGGFINYFGPQRFGGGLSSARIALAMLKEQHKRAVELIITSETSDTPTAGDYYSATGDIAGTLEKMPHERTRERYVLRALRRHGDSDYGCVCALNNIPFKWRMLYCQAFSSLLWNHMASVRVREFGLRPVEGDLVWGEGQGMADRQQKVRECVRVVSAGDIRSERYGIGDVVLPVVGFNSVLPENRVGTRLTEVLTSLGLTLASFKMKSLGVRLVCTYRKLLAYPKNLSWRWVQAPSTLTTHTVPPVTTCHHSEGSSVGGTSDKQRHLETVSHETTSRDTMENSVEVCFCLDKSCYATVMLRELMKSEVC